MSLNGLVDMKTSLLGNLGKPTMRGIRKCPKCGTMNGTRGLMCKNRDCSMVFKEAADKRKLAGDACKLFTGTEMQLYSVRLCKEKGPDYRGFVQLPLVEGLEPSSRLEGEAALLVQSASRCYVETCTRHQEQQQAHQIEVLGEGCAHIASSIACLSESSPVMLRHSAMNLLEIRPEFKHEVYSLAEQIAGPLVQRVNRQVFVVKCEPEHRHPLGYLHIAFIEQKLRDRPGMERRFFCSCDTFRGLDRSSPYYSQWGEDVRSKEPDWILKRCVHFYSCLCAFASDAKLSEEFRHYIELDAAIIDRLAASHQLQGGGEEEEGEVIAFLGKDENGESVQVEVLGSLEETRDMDLYSGGNEIQIQMETPDGKMQMITVPAGNFAATNRVSPIKVSPLAGTGRGRKRPADGSCNCASSPQQGLSATSLLGGNGGGVDEGSMSGGGMTFRQWLASVTERINQTMHFQFDGRPEPLVFHAPQAFFDCLQERISLGSKKKRLPNTTTTFIRKDALPLGTFTKYTWCLTNILHVKQIFDTPFVALEVSRAFVENKDGTFTLLQNQPSALSPDMQFTKVPGKPRIRAHELTTFLKVGCWTANQRGLSTFEIEWIPDILPLMRIGELRIKFEYGHQRNGKIERRRL